MPKIKVNIGTTGLPNWVELDANNADTATRLKNPQTIKLNGDIEGSGTFDGENESNISVQLNDTGVIDGTYTKITVDSKGRVVDGTSLLESDIPSLSPSKIIQDTTHRFMTDAEKTALNEVVNATSPNFSGTLTAEKVATKQVIATGGTHLDIGDFVDTQSIAINANNDVQVNTEYMAFNVTGNIDVFGSTNFHQTLTAPTPASASNDTTVATTAYVTSAINSSQTAPTFTGAVKAPSFQSTAPQGTAPFTVTSTTVVPNLNADMVDGFHLNQDVGNSASPTFANLNITNRLDVNNVSVIANLEASQLTAKITSGPPLKVSSTAVVANLNADLLDGKHASEFAAASHNHAASQITQDANYRFVSDAEKAAWNAKTNSTISSAAPSGGNNGDIWFQY